jgi:hypothetical protein
MAEASTIPWALTRKNLNPSPNLHRSTRAGPRERGRAQAIRAFLDEIGRDEELAEYSIRAAAKKAIEARISTHV